MGVVECEDVEVERDLDIGSSRIDGDLLMAGGSTEASHPRTPSRSISVGARPSLRDALVVAVMRADAFPLVVFSPERERCEFPNPNTLPASLTVDKFIVPAAPSLDRSAFGGLSGLRAAARTVETSSVVVTSGSGSGTILNSVKGSRFPERPIA
jgi:hypothetical protein